MELGILNNHGETCTIRYDKKLCEQAGRERKFTNRSLRASAATALFRSDAPEKVVKEFTGHRSVKALRQYEKVASKQKEAACNILTGGTSASSFSAEVEKLEHPQVSETLFPNHSTISSILIVFTHLKLVVQEQLILQ